MFEKKAPTDDKIQLYKKVIDVCCKHSHEFPHFSFSFNYWEYGSNQLFIHIGDSFCLQYDEKDFSKIEAIFNNLKGLDINKVIKEKEQLKAERKTKNDEFDNRAREIEKKISGVHSDT